MNANDPDTSTPARRQTDDVAAMIAAAVDAADEDTLRRAARAALEECGRQRTNAYRVGVPDSAPYRAIVEAAHHFEEALVVGLGGWGAVERAVVGGARPQADVPTA